MSSTPQVPANPQVSRQGLPFRMNRVVAEMKRLKAHHEPEAVHDLRVALRHCRSLAKAMAEVDPHPAWRALRKTSRKLFRQLGALRDAQVLAGWVTNLGFADSSLKAALCEALAEREHEARKNAAAALASFDGPRWSDLRRVLRKRRRLVPPDSLAARSLTLECYEKACALHEKARRSRSAASWHALRMGIKLFRYTLEGLLPQRHAEWGDELRSLQDLLGEVHDFDQLALLLKEKRNAGDDASYAQWRETIQRERSARLRAYRQATRGKHGPWQRWRAGLPQKSQLAAAGLARLNATAAALDPQPQNTRDVEKLALALFDALGTAGVSPLFRDRRTRLTLRAAARLHNIGRSEGKKARHKKARKMIARLVPPPGWFSATLEEVAWIARFHRGPEPAEASGRFGSLLPERRECVLALAGVIRLARALRRTSVSTDVALEAELSFDGIVLRAPGLADTGANAARVAAGKHLLEKVLGRVLLIKPVPGEAAPSAQPLLAPLAG